MHRGRIHNNSMNPPSTCAKALFLDRDGTINIEKNYLYKIEDFELMDGMLPLCRAAHAAGYLLIVCTNQSGIARGYYSEADYEHLTEHMKKLFSEAGCPLTAVYHCPDLASESPRRKPNAGMFQEAADAFNLSMADSLSLGDKERDLQAAAAAGVRKNFLLLEQGAREQRGSQATAQLRNPAELIQHL